MTRKQKKTLIRIIVSVVLTGVAWAVDEIFGFEGWKALLLYIAPYLVIGYDVLWDAIRNIAHGQVFDEHFLMAIATVGAFGVGDYREASAVMIFYRKRIVLRPMLLIGDAPRASGRARAASRYPRSWISVPTMP